MKLFLAAAGMTACAAFAQPPDLQSRLASVRQPFVLTGGKLGGPGAQTIRAAMRDAHFILIGEDHGLAEIPAFSSAVFTEAAPLGFRNLFIEIGPLAARRMTAILAAPDPEGAALDWAKKYPFSLAFYNWRQEFAFLREARRAAGPAFRVFGLDRGQSDFPYANPMFELALDSQNWSVFDFRELRDWANHARGLDSRMTKLIFGFDLAVVIPEGTPSDELR